MLSLLEIIGGLANNQILSGTILFLAFKRYLFTFYFIQPDYETYSLKIKTKFSTLSTTKIGYF